MRNKKKFYIISILCQCRRDLDTDRSFESAYIRQTLETRIKKPSTRFYFISEEYVQLILLIIVILIIESLFENRKEKTAAFQKFLSFMRNTGRTKIREWQNFKSFDMNEIFPFLSPNTFQTRIKLKFINLRIIYKFRLQARVNFRSTHYRKLCAHILQKYFLKNTSSEV